MALFKFFTSAYALPRPTQPSPQATVDSLQAIPAEWVEIDECVGFLFPQIRPQRHLLEVDQVHGLLHYDHYHNVMQLQDIALITPVEEVDANGTHRCWMTIQDPYTVQVWVVHFASLRRLSSWVHALRTIVHASGGSAIIRNVTFMDSGDTLALCTSSDAKDHDALVETATAVTSMCY